MLRTARECSFARALAALPLAGMIVAFPLNPAIARGAVPRSPSGIAVSWGANGDGQLGTSAPLGDTPQLVQGLQNVAAIADGGTHMLALLRDGTVMAWGSNTAGELGVGSRSLLASTPVSVRGLRHVVAVAGGYEANGDYRGFSLALLADGSVRAWGTNASEELGTAKPSKSAAPVKVPGLHNVISIAVGAGHALALERDGSVWSWGRNDSGQLGISMSIAKSHPTRVKGLPPIATIGAGSYHSFAVARHGGIWTWGFDASGQLGDGAEDNRAVPRLVQGVRGVRALAGGTQQTLALESDSSLLAWGGDDSGQLGSAQSDGSTLIPARISALPMIDSITAGEDFSLALDDSGRVWAFGANSDGQLGIGVTHGCYVYACRDKATLVPGAANVTAIAAGGATSLALTRDGHVLAWGRNDFGQLGIGTVAYRPRPAPVYNLPHVVAVSGGRDHSLALTADGHVWAWGYNWWRQLGLGVTADHRPIPAPVRGPHDIMAIAAGDQYSLALRSDGSVWAWGSNFKYGLGSDKLTRSAAPVRVNVPAPVVAVAAASEHAMALTRNGTVYAWGNNECGQLGNGTTKNNAKPALVKGVANVVAIAAFGCFSLALKRDGNVWGWGFNGDGELGSMPTATVDRSLVPVRIAGLDHVTAIAAGFGHALALRRDGIALSWGWNYNGVLCTGESTSKSRFRPAPIHGVQGVTAISAGEDTTVLLTRSGHVWACGDNQDGQLGRAPALPYSRTPVLVPALTGATHIAAGLNHILAITTG